jgi:hypothetical protein
MGGSLRIEGACIPPLPLQAPSVPRKPRCLLAHRLTSALVPICGPNRNMPTTTTATAYYEAKPS